MCPDHADMKTATTISTSQVLTSLALIIIVYAAGTYKWRRRHLEEIAAKLPGPPALPVVGNALEFVGNPQEVVNRFYEMTQEYGSPARFWLGPVLIVYVGKPEDVQIILNSRHALEKGSVYRFMSDYSANGLVTAPVDKWRIHRRVIQPAFNTKILEEFIPVFNKYSRQLVDKFKAHVDGGQFDIWNYIAALNLDIICETALGVDEKTPAHFKSEFHEALHWGIEMVMLRGYKIWLHPDFIFDTWIKLWYGFDVKEKTIEKIFRLPDTVIKQKKEEYQLRKKMESREPDGECDLESEQKPKAFIDILLELSDAGANFSDDDLRDEVITMMVAGYDTRAQTNSFCILMLAIHQDIQEKLHKEMIDIFGDSDREATVDDLKQMTYTEMVIKETLRRYPTVPVYLRRLTQDIDLTEHKLPAGCTVSICPLAMHMNPEIFPNPEQFNPENFTPEKIAARHVYSYVPFSAGPRNCIGIVYAMLSMKTTISTLVRNYRIYTGIRPEDIKLRTDMLLRSANGYPVRIVKRK